MANAVLGEEEKQRIRYCLGYLATDPVASIQLGVPRASQPMFLVEAQMNRLPESAVGIVRRIVAVMDGIEDKLIEAQDRLAAKVLGEITLNPDELQQLEKQYFNWAMRLSDVLGAPLNIYSNRFRSGGGVAMSIPVIH